MFKTSIWLVGIASLSAPLVACERLTLPMRPVGDGGSVVVETGLLPEGALIGETKTVFGGECQTWATVDGDGILMQFGWTLPIATIAGLPETAITEQIIFLELPEVVKEQTVLRSLDYTYLPHGHVPRGVYDVPHWEWHLSLYTAEERKSFDCTDRQQALPDAVPDNWIVYPDCLQTMGYHGFDLAAPEYNGQRFQFGHYLGYYHGAMSSIEPQATRERFLQRSDIDFNDVPAMKRYARSGLLPRALRATYNAEYATYVFTYRSFTSVVAS